MATSPAQQCFRDFKKECTLTKRFILIALLGGENYEYKDVKDFFQPALEQYFECLSTILDIDDRWYGRGEEYALFMLSEIIRKYTEKRDEDKAEEKDTTYDDDAERILGFPVISSDDCLRAGGRVRGQVSPTIADLAEYIEPIPVSVIEGIVIIRGANGEVKGFTICGLKNS